MKQKIIQVNCSECNKPFRTEKHWWGSAEICDSCVKKRNERNFCKRHGGKKGLDCFPCKLEGRL